MSGSRCRTLCYLTIPAETVLPVVSRVVDVDNRCSDRKIATPMRMMRTGFICLLLECEGDYFSFCQSRANRVPLYAAKPALIRPKFRTFLQSPQMDPQSRQLFPLEGEILAIWHLTHVSASPGPGAFCKKERRNPVGLRRSCYRSRR
jgi:hypothetical protein